MSMYLDRITVRKELATAIILCRYFW